MFWPSIFILDVPYERFNSWITRRVLNRRYPESTVVETYRLSEWAHFMQVSGQLPDGAITVAVDLALSVAVVQEYTSDANFKLTDEQLQQVQSHYCSEIPEYKQMCQRYKQERKQAQTYHHIKRFPELSKWEPNHGPPLTKLEQEMRDLSNMAVRVKHFRFKDQHNRTIQLSSADVELEHSYSRSSYISMCIDGRLTIGHIEAIFNHSFLFTKTTFAIVSVLEGPFTDSDSKLIYVFTNTVSQSVVPVKRLLSKPFVTALDDEEPEKLWILNTLKLNIEP